MDRISHTPGMDWCLPQSPQPTECTVVVLTHLQRRWPESVKQEVVPEGETQTGRLCSVSPGMREWERNPSGSPIPASVSLLLSLFLFFCSPRPPGPPSGSSTCPHFSPEQPLPPPPDANVNFLQQPFSPSSVFPQCSSFYFNNHHITLYINFFNSLSSQLEVISFKSSLSYSSLNPWCLAVLSLKNIG